MLNQQHKILVSSQHVSWAVSFLGDIAITANNRHQLLETIKVLETAYLSQREGYQDIRVVQPESKVVSPQAERSAS